MELALLDTLKPSRTVHSNVMLSEQPIPANQINVLSTEITYVSWQANIQVRKC